MDKIGTCMSDWKLVHVLFCMVIKEVVHMESDWQWQRLYKIILKKEGVNYELWRIWWTICTTRIERKIK